ncbi:MAG: hypothetical protein FJ137_16645 [Deltaproteobacteria bacterium]|nr:hypothetical protein [Deltaproteobacteria bacterium]
MSPITTPPVRLGLSNPHAPTTADDARSTTAAPASASAAPAAARAAGSEPTPVTPATTPVADPQRAQAARRAQHAAEVARASTLVAPERPRPLFAATVAPNTPVTGRFFPENGVPMTSMLLNAATLRHDGLHPGYVARAALQANPSVQFIVPTRAHFTAADDPRFVTERARLAQTLGVPEDRVVPVRADMAAWPQDELMAGPDGLVKPTAPGASSSTWKSTRSGAAARGTEHWTTAQRTRFGADDVAAELGLPVQRSSTIARGGDTHVIARPDGRPAAFFGPETIDFTARAHGLDTSTEAGFLRALGTTMRGLRDDGVALRDIAPLGTSERTYGQALASLTPAERSAIHPDALARFGELRDLPLPRTAFRYHTDLTAFTADGKTMFVNESDTRRHPSLEPQLRFFGFEPRRLPSPVVVPERTPGEDRIDGATVTVPVQTSYMNAVTGRGPDGRTVVLMPTQAEDPTRLTESDVRARDALQAALPDARVVPIGGRSALLGFGRMGDGHALERDWGAHCLSNVLPYVIAPTPTSAP